MKVFGGYARYYDLLYQDKDYAGEATYIRRLLDRHAPDARTLLDLGCGTGVHAALLAETGLSVTGVDRSAEMLEMARQRAEAADGATARRLEFREGDARSVRLNRRFDAVVSLFHVMSYMTSNADLTDAFTTAAAHLEPGGLFLFDCWYGPAVLSDLPAPRIKRLEDEQFRILRFAEPEMHFNDNIVDVNYHLVIEDKTSNRCETMAETHRMRYLFRPELEFMLRACGFSLISSEEWMTGKTPGTESWGVVFAGRREA